jgi:branched-chain amino acid transport system ATP-binding protein
MSLEHKGLEVRGLKAGYFGNDVLLGVSFDVRPGEVVTLLGRNGAGKSTALRAIMGLGVATGGSISMNGVELIGLFPEKIARQGIAYCPEDRGIFASLSVRENLLLPPVLMPGGMALDEIYSLFPNLKEREKSHGTQLSGGEQQMLAIARILRTGAKLLLLDEPSEGLAPVIVKAIGDIVKKLKQRGYTILLVEQNLKFAIELADRHYVIENGGIADTLDRNAIIGDPSRVERFLKV